MYWTRTGEFLLKILFLIAALMVASQVIQIYFLTSILFDASFILILLLWVMSVRKYFTRQDFLVISIIIIALVNIMVSAIRTDATVSFGYLKKWIMFSSSLLFFVIASRGPVRKDVELFIMRINLLLAILLIIIFFIKTDSVYIFNNTATTYLTFNLSNPNLTGIFLVCISSILILYARKINNVFLWCIALLIYSILVYFILETRARNAAFAVVLFIIFFIITLHKRKPIKGNGKWWIAIASVWPIIFALLYIQLINWIENWGGFSLLVSEGKSLSSRDSIWRAALQSFLQNPLFGAYSQISNGTGTSQMHNTHIDILASYGIVVFILTMILLYQVMMRIYRRCSYSNYLIPLFGFIVALSLGMGEAAVFSGGVGIHIFVGSFLLITISGKKEIRTFATKKNGALYD